MTKSKVSFEEFRIYYESTERVSERRISNNRWNYSVCIAILAGIGLLIKWVLDERRFLAPGILSAFALAGMAGVFAYLWLKQIDDFKSLNAAKFEVLNEMAPNLDFGVDPQGQPSECQSYEPFRREWENLQRAKALVQLSSSRTPFLALGSSNAERFIPKAFMALFAAVALFCCMLIGTNWAEFSRSVSCSVSNIDGTDCSAKVALAP